MVVRRSSSCPKSILGERSCPRCNTIMRALSGGGELAEFGCRLVIMEGPERVGEQILLGGEGTIKVGKNQERQLRLIGPLVSRAHARLIPSIDGGWAIEDERSTNGVYLNDRRIESETLHDGDVVRIGEYLLMFKREGAGFEGAGGGKVESSREASLASVAATTVAEPQMIPLENESDDGLFELTDAKELAPAGTGGSGAHAVAAPAPLRAIPINLPRPKCPSCQRTLPAGAKICVSCGIDIKTGRALVTSRGLDENCAGGSREHLGALHQLVYPRGVGADRVRGVWHAQAVCGVGDHRADDRNEPGVPAGAARVAARSSQRCARVDAVVGEPGEDASSALSKSASASGSSIARRSHRGLAAARPSNGRPGGNWMMRLTRCWRSRFRRPRRGFTGISF